MAISLNQFSTAAAAGGALRLEGADGAEAPAVGRMGVGGRIVQWFRGDSAKAENRATMNAFVASLEQRYGSDFAAVARNSLDIAGGKPLSARTVTQLVAQGAQHAKTVAALNAGVAYHYSENNAHGARHCFGQLFDTIAAEKGLRLDAAHPDLNLGKLQGAIRKEIAFAGNGHRIVGQEQARAIAEKHISRFLDNKQALLEAADRLTGDPAERALLHEMALSHDFSEPAFLVALWQNRDAGQTLLAELGRAEASPAERIAALAAFHARYDAALAPLLAAMAEQQREVGADDMIDFNSNLLEIGMKSAGLDARGAQALWANLGAAETTALRDSLTYLAFNGYEHDVGLGSVSALRSFNDTLSVAINLVGGVLGKSPDDISAASALPHAVNHVDAVPEAVVGALHQAGLGDVNFTLDKRIALADPAQRQQLSDALLNARLTRDVIRSGDPAAMLAQADVLQQLHAGLGALDGDTAAALRGVLEQSFVAVAAAWAEAPRTAGGDPSVVVRELERACQVLADFTAHGATAAGAARCETLRTGQQSEIFTRNLPEFRQLDGDPESQAQMIFSRREFGRVIVDELRTTLARPLDPATQPELRERSLQLRAIAASLDLAAPDPERMAALDRVRMGSSDTIAGKSGGGEVESGRRLATANWQAANQRAREIAHSGEALTLDHLRELNRLLNDGLPANAGRPGELRATTETAGGGPAYPSPEHLPALMDEFMAWLESAGRDADPLELAALAYQKLVSIHPFADANGRTCRLVADIILQRGGLPPAAFQGSGEVNVAVFGVPQRGQDNITPDEAVRRMGVAVARSLALLGGEGARV